MPNHLHCIWQMPSGDCDYSTRWSIIKRLFSKTYIAASGRPLPQTDSRRKKRELGVWQRRFWEHRIRDEADYWNHAHYIHYNPVKHGLVERIADKSADNVADSIEQSKTRPLWRLVAALGIRNVGGQSAQILADEFGSLDALMNATVETLTAIDQIGPVMAESIYDYFHDADNIKVIKAMLTAGVKPAAPKEKASNILNGMTLVITGTLKTLTRSQIKQLIKDHGGKTSSSVSKKTSLLVAGENAGSKRNKAEPLGVDIRRRVFTTH